VRRTQLAGAVLTAVLALAAVPGLVVSRPPSPPTTLEAAAFQAVRLAVPADRSMAAIGGLDPSSSSADVLDRGELLLEPAAPTAEGAPAGRPVVRLPAARAGFVWKPARFVLRGYATFYDNGTTAMRLPRGTVIRVCGAGGCLERVVTDYGPAPVKGRIIDLDRPDFFAVCGCGWWSGTTYVTVYVY
jgi:hypothetical protein